MGSKLQSRRGSPRRPPICHPPPPPPPPPVVSITCSLKLFGPNYPFSLGRADVDACNSAYPPGTGFASYSLVLVPNIPGSWVVTPLNCNRTGNFEFAMPPPPGPLQGTFTVFWPDGSTCQATDTITI